MPCPLGVVRIIPGLYSTEHVQVLDEGRTQADLEAVTSFRLIEIAKPGARLNAAPRPPAVVPWARTASKHTDGASPGDPEISVVIRILKFSRVWWSTHREPLCSSGAHQTLKLAMPGRTASRRVT